MIISGILRNQQSTGTAGQGHHSIDVLYPMRCWLKQIEINNIAIARLICRLIPAQCPFARTISWKQRKLIVIPPLCKINPLYDELMELRFRALCFLADQPSESIYIGRAINAEATKSY